MRKLRWAMDAGGFWDLDLETPATMEGTARPVPGLPLPLGLSRGARLSRPKQLDFMHRFMASPLVPAYSIDRGLTLNHARTVHLRHNWSATPIQRFHLRNFLAAIKEDEDGGRLKGLSWAKEVGWKVIDACTFGLGTELLITPDTSLLLERYKDGDGKNETGSRTKAVLQHQLSQHNLTLEAAWPGLFVDENGTYWDVPSSMAFDLSSDSSGSGLSYHLCVQHNSGQPKNLLHGESKETPRSLLPGLCAKVAFSFKKNLDIWRKKEGKLKMIQPYDMFQSDPHVSLSGIVGSVVGASFIENSAQLPMDQGPHHFRPVALQLQRNDASLLADFYGSVSLAAQHGHFQRLFFDLSRFSARIDFTSGTSFLRGASDVVHDLISSRRFDVESLHAICPKVTLSFQQQIAGPFSFRLESKLAHNFKNHGQCISVDDSIFAIEYAMQVLGSARATAWYSSKNKEAMVELRFFEN